MNNKHTQILKAIKGTLFTPKENLSIIMIYSGTESLSQWLLVSKATNGLQVLNDMHICLVTRRAKGTLCAQSDQFSGNELCTTCVQFEFPSQGWLVCELKACSPLGDLFPLPTTIGFLTYTDTGL